VVKDSTFDHPTNTRWRLQDLRLSLVSKHYSDLNIFTMNIIRFNSSRIDQFAGPTWEEIHMKPIRNPWKDSVTQELGNQSHSRYGHRPQPRHAAHNILDRSFGMKDGTGFGTKTLTNGEGRPDFLSPTRGIPT